MRMQDVDSDLQRTARLTQPGARTLKDLIPLPGFDMLSCAIVILHIILIGIEVNYVAQNMKPPEPVSWVILVVYVWYVCEFVLRLWADDWTFFRSRSWRWHCFDLFLIVLTVIETLGSVHNEASDKGYNVARWFRLIRMTRIVRIIRVIRALRWVRDFCKMVYAIGHSFRTFLWALCLQSLLTYAVSICLTESTTRYLVDQDDRVLADFFGSVGKSFYTLYVSIMDGISWGEVMKAVQRLEISMPILFITYVTGSILCVSNVVTSIFIDSAMQTTNYYKELLLMEERDKRLMYTRSLCVAFHDIDVDSDGQINIDDLETFLSNPENRQFLDALDLKVTDAYMLMELIDTSNTGAVSIDEFCECCMNLKGEAKSFDIQCMILEMRRVLNVTEQFLHQLNTKVTSMSSQVFKRGWAGAATTSSSTLKDDQVSFIPSTPSASSPRRTSLDSSMTSHSSGRAVDDLCTV